jgi:anti-sigma-K factor RskA
VSEQDAVRDLTCDEVRELAGAFVLGALEPADAAAVRAHLATCTDADAEIAELGGVLPVLAESVPIVEPPAGLKARIMAAAAADLATRWENEAVAAVAPGPAPASAAPGTPAEPTPFPSGTERAARRTRVSAGTWVLRIAAVLAIVLLGGWNLLLQGQLNAAKTYEQSVATVLDVAAQPGSHTAILTAAGGTGSGLAAISATGEVTLAMQDLAPTSGTTVYTAWVIGGDGVPVPLGDFKVGNSGTASFQATGAPSANGVVLALTLEPGPGATTPTPPIISKGVATSAG